MDRPRIFPLFPLTARKLGAAMVLAVCLIAVLTLAGSILNAEALTRVGQGMEPMRVATALCMLLCAFALGYLLASGERHGKNIAVPTVAIAVSIVGLLTLASYVVERWTGQPWALAGLPLLHQFLVWPFRMAMITACLFCIFGPALLLLGQRGGRCANLGHVLLLPVAGATYVVLIGYLFHIRAFYEWMHVAVALNTCIAFCCLCLAAFCARPDTWLTGAFTGDKAGAIMARRLLPALFILPLVIGWFRIHGERAGIFGSEVGVALVAGAYTVCFLGLVWLSARSVNKIDRRRREAEEVLRDSQRRLSAVFNGVTESIWLMDLEGNILSANATAAARLGMGVEELVGRNCYDLIPLQVGELRKRRIAEMAGSKMPIRFEDERAGIIFDHTFYPVCDARGNVVQVAIFSMDITRRKRMETQLLRMAGRNELLSATAGELLRTHEPQKLVESLCRKVMEHLDCHAFFNFLVDEHADRLHLNACAGIPDEEARRIEWLDYGAAVCGCAARDGCRIVAERIPDTPDVRTELVKSYGIKAYACYPILGGDGNVLGTLSFGTRTRETFSEEDLSLMKAVTDQVAVALERMRSTQELFRSREEWEETFNLIPDLIAVLDEHHRIVRVNMAMAGRLGVPPQEAAGLYCYHCVHNAQGPIPSCPHAEMLRDRKFHMAEVHEPNLGGDFLVSVTPVFDERGNLTGGVHVARDITERKKKEEELQELNRMLKALSKSSQAMVRAKNEPEYLNEVCRSILEDCGYAMVWIGYGENDEAKTVRPVAQAGFEDGYLATLNLTWADARLGRGPTGTAIRTGEASLCRDMRTNPAFAPWRDEAVKRGYASSIALPLVADGRAFGAITIYSGEPDPFSADEIRLLSEMSNDLSQGISAIRLAEARAKAEAALRKSAEDLGRSNKDLEQFAYVASHDLQEPLRAVAGFMALLSKRYREKLDDEAREYIGFAVEGAERMQRLINDLLAFSRVGTMGGAFSPMSMNSALDAARRNLRVAIEESGAAVECEPLPEVTADATQMSQLLQNLLNNAIKFRGKTTPRIHVGARREEGKWVFGVSDNGIGIEAQYFERIFLIFQRLHTRAEYPGTGIGLALCKKIVERHGGRLWVESAPAGGSVFYFTMPDRPGPN